jgi:hypothetical protein
VLQRIADRPRGLSFLIAAVLVIAGTLVAHAQTDQPCDDSFMPVPPLLLNPGFNASFDLAVDWNWREEGHAWNLDSLRAFAKAVKGNSGGLGDPGLVDRLVGYFSEDLDPDPDIIEVAQESGSYSRFHICLREASGDIFSGGNKVELACVVQTSPGRDEVVSATHLAAESFAHEWQHITFNRIMAGPKFGGILGTNEFLSKCSEFLADWDRMWPVHDNPYERSILGADDWYAECIHPDHGEHKYASFGLFGAHLMAQFAGDPATMEDDLLRRWLGSSEEDIFGNTIWRISPSSLAVLLGESAYDARFTAENGSGRLQEMFHEFALSLWVNAALADQGETGIWAGGRLPQDHYQLFRNVNGVDCADDARSLPLFLTVGDEPRIVSGPLLPPDVHPEGPSGCADGYDSEEFPRYPQVATYGFTVLPFTADPSLPGDECRSFHLRLNLEDSIYCPTANTEIPVSGHSNHRLNLSIIGYPEAVDSLDLHGGEAVEISREAYPLNSLPGQIEIAVPCFASRWRSLAMVLSVTENMPANGYVWSRIFPFSYEVWSEATPSDGLVNGEVNWGGPGQMICLDRDLLITSEAELTIAAGSELVAARPLDIRVLGELKLEGEAGSAIRLGHARQAGYSWGHLDIGDGGEFSVSHAMIDGLGQLRSSSQAKVDLADCIWDAGDQALPFDLRGESLQLSEVDLLRSAGVHLSKGVIEGGRIQAGPGLAGPLLTLSGEAEACRDLLIEEAIIGIRVAGADVVLESCTILAGGLQSHAANGIEILGGGRLSAVNLGLFGFRTGIEVGGNGHLVLRSSTLDGFNTGVEIKGGGGLVDLGHDSFGEEGWGRNNFSPRPGLSSRAVVNRGSAECLALWNYWGISLPTGSLFEGQVAWDPFGIVPFEAEVPLSAPENADQATLPAAVLESAWPNPFNPQVSFSFLVEDEARDLVLEIHDVLGRRRAIAFAGRFAPGRHERGWEARDDTGHPLASGVYFARFRGEQASLKLLLLR